jgi:DNA-binding NarL/FixJ family response regulator
VGLNKELSNRANRNLEHMRNDQESDWPQRLIKGMKDTKFGPKSLSPTEKDVLFHASHGLLTKEIAFKLDRSELTIKSHLRSASRKLAARNKVHAVAIALREGLIK